MMVGVSDPIGFLDRSGVDWEISTAILRKADEIQSGRRREELQSIIDSIGKSVGSRVAEQIGRMFR